MNAFIPSSHRAQTLCDPVGRKYGAPTLPFWRKSIHTAAAVISLGMHSLQSAAAAGLDTQAEVCWALQCVFCSEFEFEVLFFFFVIKFVCLVEFFSFRLISCR